LSVGLDANFATERGKQNGAKLPHEKTGGARRKNERNKEERETPKLATRNPQPILPQKRQPARQRKWADFA